MKLLTVGVGETALHVTRTGQFWCDTADYHTKIVFRPQRLKFWSPEFVLECSFGDQRHTMTKKGVNGVKERIVNSPC